MGEKPIDRQLLETLARGAQLAFSNAEMLYKEAQILGRAGAFARALTLHQISVEECSKVDMLGAAAMSHVMGHDVDVTKLAVTLRQHKAKNYNNAYFSLVSKTEQEAMKSGDVSRSLGVFKAQQSDIHKWLNDNKNASLYVDYVDGAFVAPVDRVPEGLAAQLDAINAFYLNYASTHLALTQKLLEDPERHVEDANDLLLRLEELKSAGDATGQRFHDIIESWVDEKRRRASSNRP